jgi:hypothetical protein
MTMVMPSWGDDSGTFNTDFTWKYIEATKTLIISGNGYMSTSKPKTMPFNDYRPIIEAAIIEEGAKTIGLHLFSDCTALKTVSIPNTVETIYKNTFSGCSSLISIYIPASVKLIDYPVFSGCISLESIIVDPDNKTYNSPNNCNAIIKSGFHEVNLVCGCKNTVIPNDVTYIWPHAFSGLTSLKYIAIPESVKNIQAHAFEHTGLTSMAIPHTVTDIGEAAFAECEDLETVIIGNGIEKISYAAFQDCNSLSTLTLGNKVKTISEWAFKGCTKLGALTIPPSTEDIDNEAFLDCHGLQSIKVEEGNKNYDSRNDCNALIRKSDNWLILGCDNTVIPEGVTVIGEFAFIRCNGLKSLHFPKSLEGFFYRSIYDCRNIQSLSVDEENATLDSRNNCNAIISSYDNELLLGCCNTVIPEDIKIINKYAFVNCEHLKSISIPASVSELEQYSFYHCLSLTDIFCDRKTPPYAVNAFIETPLENITLHVPEGATKQYNYAPWTKFAKIVEMHYYEPGDLDGDNDVTFDDVDILVSYLKLESTEIDEEAADFNHDGILNVADVVAMINYIREQRKSTE